MIRQPESGSSFSIELGTLRSNKRAQSSQLVNIERWTTSVYEEQELASSAEIRLVM